MTATHDSAAITGRDQADEDASARIAKVVEFPPARRLATPLPAPPRTSTQTRARIARRQAATLNLRMVQRGNVFELRNAEDAVLVGSIAAVENYLKDQYEPNRPGPALARIPAEWRQRSRHIANTSRQLDSPRGPSGFAGQRWHGSAVKYCWALFLLVLTGPGAYALDIGFRPRGPGYLRSYLRRSPRSPRGRRWRR
jgi:hypothetical protein